MNDVLKNMIDVTRSVVLEIREELAKEYDITDGEYKNYTGLCDDAYIKFKDKIEGLNNKCEATVKVIHYHGEQSHNPTIDRRNWCYQHTWMAIMDPDTKEKIYVDPTSQQFQWLYNDIPDYYISTESPKWYMSDRDNPFFIIYDEGGWRKWVAINIIDKFDYYIWGGLCQLYRKLLKRK